MQLARFLSVGVVNTLIGYAIIFFVMYVIELSPTVSNAIGYSTGIFLSFAMHRSITFKVNSTAPENNRTREFVRFLLVFAIAYLANLFTLMYLINVLEIHKGLSQIGAGVVYVAISFVLSKNYVFKRHRD